MTDGYITSDQIGAGDDTVYGADVAPNAPVQDMWAFDLLAGQASAGRDADPGAYTGGTGGAGLGGEAEPMGPGGTGPGGTVYERRGF